MNMNFIPSSSRMEFPDRSHLDAAVTGHRNLRGHLDGLIQIPGLDQNEPAQLFFGLGEGTVSGGQLAVPHPDGGGRLDRLQGMGSEEVASSPKIVIISQAFVD